MKTIAGELMGGDYAPKVVVEGIKSALEKYDKLKIKAYGTSGSWTDNHDRVEFIEVTEVITSEDDPVRAVRRKKDSSIVRAAKAVKEGETVAFVFTGNKDAIITIEL